MSKFYITSAIPYVNAKPHIGHALEFIQADTLARYHRIIGDTTLYLCGSDENALKNVQAAEKAGENVQEFVDKNSQLFTQLANALDIRFDVFQKGSNPQHFIASQKLWQLCAANGDIYKKAYTGLYCVGCEMFYTKDELNEQGECFEHPGKKLEEVTEENYFFALSKYKERITELITSDQLQIVPQNRKHEVLSFLKQELEDISISRSNERAKNWGVPVPGDETQRMYVWFDALNIYQSGVGFGSDEKTYQQWWPADLHVIGKGILRFHAVFWPAFLLSAKLPLPKKLFVHDYITVNGQKMSKTLGNVIDPHDLINKFGVDGVRYFLLRSVSPFTDGDFSEEKCTTVYNADLANGLGNLTSRVAKLCELAHFEKEQTTPLSFQQIVDKDAYISALKEFRFNDALAFVWEKIAAADKYIDASKPWELIKKQDPRLHEILDHLINEIQEIAFFLAPFLPETAQKIGVHFNKNDITALKTLFPRI